MVLEGDTLQSIAQRVYGNGSLWYVLAAANAVTDAELVVGSTLKVPSVKTTANDATTFKPFDPNAIQGSTTPSLPYITPPPKKHCSGIGVVLAVVAVVIACVVAPYLAPAIQGVLGTGALATGVTAGASMAVGTAVAQGVGSAAGVTTFSWRDVAVAGISAGLTAGLGQALLGVEKLTTTINGVKTLNAGGRVLQGIGSYGSSVVANAAVGRDTHFSWTSVAATAVGSYLSAKINPNGTLPLSKGTTDFGKFVNSFGGSYVNGAFAATSRRLFGQGEQDWGQLAVDAFGNALGNAAVRGIQTASTLRSLSPDQRSNYEQMVRDGIPKADALRYAQQTLGSLPAYLYRQPLDAEQSATRLDELKSLQAGLMASGRDSRTTRTEGGASASGGRGSFAYDPNLWDMGPEGYPVPKSVSIIDAMQYDPTLANAGYDALYSNSLRYAIGAAERGSAVPFEFPGLNASPQALFEYNKDVQWWLYERSKSTPQIGAAQGVLIDAVGGTLGVLDSLWNGVSGAATLAYDFAGTGMLETGVSDLLGLRSYHQQSADQLGATVAGVVDFVSNDGRASKIYNHFADRFAQADRYGAQGDVASRLTAARVRSSAVFDIGTGLVTAGEGAAFTWAKASGLAKAGIGRIGGGATDAVVSQAAIRARVEANIAESAAARASSKFDQFARSKEWPPNNGFVVGASERFTLWPGHVVDRFGSMQGSFVAEYGTAYRARALKPGSDRLPYHAFEVTQPIEVTAGPARGWFGYEGGGMQYKFDESVSQLIARGALRKKQ